MTYLKLLYSIKIYFPIQLKFLDQSETFVLLSITFALPAWKVSLMIGNPCRATFYRWLSLTHCSVRARYIAVIFLRITHEKHPIARPLGRGMGCDLQVQSLTEVLPLLLLGCVLNRVVYDRDISYHRFALPWRHMGVMASHITGIFPVCPETKGISKLNITGTLRWESI